MTTVGNLGNAVRSEWVRLRRMWKLAAMAGGLAVLATVFAFSGSGVGPGARDGAVVDADASTAALEQADGIVAGLGTAATLAGLIGLVLWALSVARDLQFGTIRVLLVSQPRRVVYLGGKLLALAFATVVMSTLVVAVSIGSAFVAAAANDVATGAWAWSEAGRAVLDLGLGTIAWGAIGGLLAVVTRSSAAAIGGGIGFLLLGEGLLGSVWTDAAGWLPGGSIENVFTGGAGDVSYGHSALLVLGYVAAAILVSLVIVHRRDVVE